MSNTRYILLSLTAPAVLYRVLQVRNLPSQNILSHLLGLDHHPSSLWGEGVVGAGPPPRPLRRGGFRKVTTINFGEYVEHRKKKVFQVEPEPACYYMMITKVPLKIPTLHS